jgi:hypothetical protein
VRLTGAFDRLVIYLKENPSSLSAQQKNLSALIEACLGDLELKLKSRVLSSTDEELQVVKDLMYRIGAESGMIEAEEVLPKVVAYLRGY